MLVSTQFQKNFEINKNSYLDVTELIKILKKKEKVFHLKINGLILELYQTTINKKI